VSQQPPKLPKLVFLVYICPKGVYPLQRFFTKFGLVERVPGPHRHTKFHRSGLKNVCLQPEKARKIAIFGINLTLYKNFGGP